MVYIYVHTQSIRTMDQGEVAFTEGLGAESFHRILTPLIGSGAAGINIVYVYFLCIFGLTKHWGKKSIQWSNFIGQSTTTAASTILGI